MLVGKRSTLRSCGNTYSRPRSQQSLFVRACGKRCVDSSFSATTSWRKCPPMARSGLKVSCSHNTIESARGKFHLDGNIAKAEASDSNRVIGWGLAGPSWRNSCRTESGLSFAAGSLARGMKSPTTKDFEELKRLGPYLRGRPVGAIVCEPPTCPCVVEVFCDADHAGELVTRTSRSGVAVMWVHTLIKHGSAVQSTTALGSGESEYYALCTSSAHVLGLETMRSDRCCGVSELQNSHAWRQQRGRRHICSTRIGQQLSH